MRVLSFQILERPGGTETANRFVCAMSIGTPTGVFSRGNGSSSSLSEQELQSESDSEDDDGHRSSSFFAIAGVLFPRQLGNRRTTMVEKSGTSCGPTTGKTKLVSEDVVFLANRNGWDLSAAKPGRENVRRRQVED